MSIGKIILFVLPEVLKQLLFFLLIYRNALCLIMLPWFISRRAVYFGMLAWLLARPADVECDIVVARYGQSVDWLGALVAFLQSHRVRVRAVRVYNKGDDFDTSDLVHDLHGTPLVVKRLPNVGRCDETYLHYLICFYNKLPSCILCVKDSSTRYISGYLLNYAMLYILRAARNRLIGPCDPCPFLG